MKTYLIINNSGEPLSDVVKDRIKSIGSFFFLQQDLFFVRTERETAKEVYEAIVKTDFSTLSIVILSVDPTVIQSYWGRSKNEFWNWLSAKDQQR